MGGVPWYAGDDAELLRLIREGRSDRYIAEWLGRSERGIEWRRRHLKQFRPPKKRRLAILEGRSKKRIVRRSVDKLRRGPIHAAIRMDQLPEYYALGWVVARDEGDSCTLAWPNAREPQWPQVAA